MAGETVNELIEFIKNENIRTTDAPNPQIDRNLGTSFD